MVLPLVERMQGQGRWLQRSSLSRAGRFAGGTWATVAAESAAAAAIYAAVTLLTTRPAISGAGAAPAVHSPGASPKEEPPPPVALTPTCARTRT